MKHRTPAITAEQRAALDRAKKGLSPFRAWHGPQRHKHVDAEKVVPLHARQVRR